jgi:hypothetical protein
VADEVAAGELAERGVAIELRLLSQPVVRRDERLLFPPHRSADAGAVETRVVEDVDQRLTLGRDAGGVEGVAQLDAGARAVGERAAHGLDATLGRIPPPGLLKPRPA